MDQILDSLEKMNDSQRSEYFIGLGRGGGQTNKAVMIMQAWIKRQQEVESE